MTSKRGRILVIRGGAIGDFILTLPAIAALRHAFPETHLELLAYPRVAALAQAAGLVDAFRSIESGSLARFFARNAPLDPGWMAYFESFHLVISYLYDPDDLFKSSVGRSSKAQFIQAQHRPDESQNIHATTVFLKPLEQLAIFDADPIPRLSLPTGELQRTLSEISKPSPANSNNGSWLAIHPGSGSHKKNWPEDQWLALLRSLRPANLLLIGGEAEAGRLDRFERALCQNPAPPRIVLAQNLPLADLARLLAQTHHFIGHDSGITHLAAALGIKVLVLWGPSRAEIWRPLGPLIQVLPSPAGDLMQLSPETVQDALHATFRTDSAHPPVR